MPLGLYKYRDLLDEGGTARDDLRRPALAHIVESTGAGVRVAPLRAAYALKAIAGLFGTVCDFGPYDPHTPVVTIAVTGCCDSGTYVHRQHREAAACSLFLRNGGQTRPMSS